MGKFKGRLASTFLVLALTVLCVQSIDALSTRTQVLTESEQKTRNHAASLLYVKLANLSQPHKRSDITQTVHRFVSDNVLVDGATVFDAQGQLVAQMGRGNDRLLERPFGHSIARIPIKSGNADAGYVLLSFQHGRRQIETLFHFAAMACAIVVLCILGIWFVSHSARAVFSILKQPLDHS